MKRIEMFFCPRGSVDLVRNAARGCCFVVYNVLGVLALVAHTRDGDGIGTGDEGYG